MASANCGVPVTVAASWKSTVTSMTSPAMKTPFAPCASPPTRTPVTTGPARAPSTMKRRSFAIACVPKASAASLPAPSRMVLPISSIVPVLTPFGAAAPDHTVYSNTRELVPLPDT